MLQTARTGHILLFYWTMKSKRGVPSQTPAALGSHGSLSSLRWDSFPEQLFRLRDVLSQSLDAPTFVRLSPAVLPTKDRSDQVQVVWCAKQAVLVCPPLAYSEFSRQAEQEINLFKEACDYLDEDEDLQISRFYGNGKRMLLAEGCVLGWMATLPMGNPLILRPATGCRCGFSRLDSSLRCS